MSSTSNHSIHLFHSPLSRWGSSSRPIATGYHSEISLKLPTGSTSFSNPVSTSSHIPTALSPNSFRICGCCCNKARSSLMHCSEGVETYLMILFSHASALAESFVFVLTCSLTSPSFKWLDPQLLCCTMMILSRPNWVSRARMSVRELLTRPPTLRITIASPGLSWRKLYGLARLSKQETRWSSAITRRPQVYQLSLIRRWGPLSLKLPRKMVIKFGTALCAVLA